MWCVAAGCRPAAEDGASDRASVRTSVLREDARRILNTYCAECHLPSLPTAIEGALRVFDLSEERWSDRMTDAQLRSARYRLGTDLVPTQGEAEALPLAVPAAELARFDEFLAAELATRSH